MLSKMPLKWKVLLSTQAVVTAVLIVRRINPEFDWFQRRTLEIKSDETTGSIKIDTKLHEK
jgi:hypothetical protein